MSYTKKEMSIEDLEFYEEDSRDSNNVTVEYNPSGNFYYINDTFKCIAVTGYTPEKYKSWRLEKYTEIFSDFVPKTDRVRFDSDAGEGYFLHKRLNNKESKKLPNNIYKFDWVDGFGLCAFPLKGVGTDKSIPISTTIDGLQQDIEMFFLKRAVYNELSVRHRRGALVFGPPGVGKTFNIIQSLKKSIEKENTSAFIITPKITDLSYLTGWQPAMKDGNVIFVIEELTDRMGQNVESLLSFLDGELSWDNCYTIGTTNYPEELEQNIVDRPGRFDLLLEVGLPNESDRRIYLEHFLGEDNDVVDELVESTKDMSIAHLKEICIRSKLFDKDPSAVFKDLQIHKKKVKSKFAKKGKTGFGEE